MIIKKLTQVVTKDYKEYTHAFFVTKEDMDAILNLIGHTCKENRLKITNTDEYTEEMDDVLSNSVFQPLWEVYNP